MRVDDGWEPGETEDYLREDPWVVDDEQWEPAEDMTYAGEPLQNPWEIV